MQKKANFYEKQPQKIKNITKKECKLVLKRVNFGFVLKNKANSPTCGGKANIETINPKQYQIS